MSAAASGPCASWRARAVARHPCPHEAAGWSSAAAGLRGGASSSYVVRAASWLSRGARRQAARPSPTNASKRQRSLWPSRALCLLLCAKFCSNPQVPCPSAPTLWGACASKSLPGTGWRVGQRRAGRCGGWVLARALRGSCRHATRPLAMLPALPRMYVSLQRLASAGRILARSSDLGPLRCLFCASPDLGHAELLRAAVITAKQERCGAAP